MIDINPNCIDCLYFGEDTDKSRKTDRPACKAFPKGIPDEILNAEVLHDKSYPGDNGIRYKNQYEADFEKLKEMEKEMEKDREEMKKMGIL